MTEQFEKLGYTLVKADDITGFYTVIDTEKEGPTLLILGELDSIICPGHKDADPVTGAVHSCGHNAQSATLLGIAAALKEEGALDGLCGKIKLCAVPAEELLEIDFRSQLIKEGKIKYYGGKTEFMHRGYFDDVDIAFMVHTNDGTNFSVNLGSVGCMAKRIIYKGTAAHAGGSPEKGKNVMLAVATAIMNLYAIPRHSGGTTRINVGTVTAGSGRNVIADVAKMEIELRGETTELNDYVVAYATNVIEAAAKMHGCTYEMVVMGGAQSMTSDKAMIDRIRAAAEAVGLKVSKDDSNRSGGSEDYSYMMTRVQEQGGIATFMRVHSKQSAPGHNRRFDIDEVAIPNAVKTFCAAVYDIVK